MQRSKHWNYIFTIFIVLYIHLIDSPGAKSQQVTINDQHSESYVNKQTAAEPNITEVY